VNISLLHPICHVPSGILGRIFVDFVEQERSRPRHDFSPNSRFMEVTIHFGPFSLPLPEIATNQPRLCTYVRIPTVGSSPGFRLQSQNLGVKQLGRRLFEESLSCSSGRPRSPPDDMEMNIEFLQNTPSSTLFELLSPIMDPIFKLPRLAVPHTDLSNLAAGTHSLRLLTQSFRGP
jgi:hypothetical protein